MTTGHIIGHTVGHTVGHAVGASLASGPPYSPYEWLDADQSYMSLAAGPVVSSLTGKIAGIVVSQAVNASRPAFTGGSIVFDGTDDELTNVSVSGLEFMSYGRPASSDWCVYELVNFTAADAQRCGVMCANNITQSTNLRIRATGNSVRGEQGASFTAYDGVDVGSWIWVYYGIDGTSFKKRSMGGTEDSVAATSFTADVSRLYLGSIAGGNYSYLQSKGVAIYNFWPSAAQHAKIQAWAVARMAT